MDIVDAQIHLGPGGIAETIAAMDALGIASVLVDEWWMGTPGHPHYALEGGATRTASPTAEMAAWLHPERFSYLVRVDYRDPDVRHVIRFARDAKYARAIRVSPGMSRDEIAGFADGSYDTVFGAAADYGLPVFVFIAGHSELLRPYLDRYPDLRVVICHCGMPPGRLMRPILAGMEGLPDSAEYWDNVGSAGATDAWEQVMRIADHPGVALKWAHAPMMFDLPGYPHLGLRPFLRRAIDAFGADRIMWASDVTMNMTGETWAELLFSVKDNPDLSAEERANILGGTARHWLDWSR